MGNSRTSLLKRLTWIGFVAALVWLTGLAVFAGVMPGQPAVGPDRSADAIVVLTGDKGRLEAGMDLLNRKKGGRLLVSGVHQSVAVGDLAKLTGRPHDLFHCCVDLDHLSRNTIDNAMMTAEWVEKNNFQTLYLVTSAYHMQRSMLLMESAMPGCEFLPYAVDTPISFQGLVVEYSKFIVTYARTVFDV